MKAPAPVTETLFASLQYALPTHALSRIVHRLTRTRSPLIKNAMIEIFCRRYAIDLHEAKIPDPRAYATFNDFFIRELRADARPLPHDADALACPVDGSISQIGALQGDRLVQAKGRHFNSAELLGDPEDGAAFEGGAFATLYLAPRNYHRVHMPLAGTLLHTRLVPGRLFSVNPATARHVPRLFARNERLVCLFDTAVGIVALVLVGAMLVGSIETVWAGEATPPRARHIVERDYRSEPVRLERGAELGRFNMGSSVILLCPRGAVAWAAGLEPGTDVRMGEALAASA